MYKHSWLKAIMESDFNKDKYSTTLAMSVGEITVNE